MATSVNNNGTRKQVQAQAFERIEQNATIVENQTQVVEQNSSVLANDAEKSGIIERLDNHFATLKSYTCEDKDTLIVLTSKNIPSNVSVIFTKNKTNDGYKINVKNEAILNVGTDAKGLTQEQIGANTLITNLVGKFRSSVSGYISEVMDICRTWSQLVAACEYQAKLQRERNYNKFARKLDD